MNVKIYVYGSDACYCQGWQYLGVATTKRGILLIDVILQILLPMMRNNIPSYKHDTKPQHFAKYKAFMSAAFTSR